MMHKSLASDINMSWNHSYFNSRMRGRNHANFSGGHTIPEPFALLGDGRLEKSRMCREGKHIPLIELSSLSRTFLHWHAREVRLAEASSRTTIARWSMQSKFREGILTATPFRFNGVHFSRPAHPLKTYSANRLYFECFLSGRLELEEKNLDCASLGAIGHLEVESEKYPRHSLGFERITEILSDHHSAATKLLQLFVCLCLILEYDEASREDVHLVLMIPGIKVSLYHSLQIR